MKKTSVFVLTAALAGVLIPVSCKSSGDKKEDAKPAEATTGSAATPAPAAAAAPVLPAPPGIDVAVMDETADPCTDFYRYACGSWLDKTEIPADRASWSRGFMSVLERNELILKDILEKTAAGQAPEATPYAQQIGDFYASCMDDALVEKGAAVLTAELKAFDKVKDPKSLTAAVVTLHGRGIPAFFSFASTQDFENSTSVIAEVDQAGLGLPDRDYYFNADEKSAKIRTLYVAHVGKMLELAGVKDSARMAASILELETALAKASLTNVERRDPKKVFHPMDAKALKKLASNVDWDGYFKGLGVTPGARINVTHQPFFTAVSDLMKSVKPDVARAYLSWHLVRAAAENLPKAFVDEEFSFKSKAFTGATQDLPRWKKCVAMTDDALGEALAVPFIKLTFGEDGKATTQAMVVNIEKAFEANLAGLAWMDADTKAKALEKLKAIINKIGYPDQLRKYDSLVIKRDAFLPNGLASAAFEKKRDLAKIGKPVDKNEWYMTPPTVNAYYNPLVNEIVFPAGILQPPFFSKEATPAVNYGAMGMVVGHEVTHGFDDQGSQFDAQGNLKNWWTEASSKAFTERTACVKTQFDGYTAIDDLKVKGDLTLGENTADLGGLKLAYMAMTEATKDRPDNAQYRFKPAQQFFLGYAQSWCSKYRPEHARMRAQTDPHSPPFLRVNGPLGNLATFKEAFACKDDAKMVRPAADRCEVW